MEIYEFQKTFAERLDESMSVLWWEDHYIPTSQVKCEWSYFIELQIEPSGWQALWKIPRNICEKYKIRFPSIVFGSIEQVNFRDLNAIYNIKAVQDDSVHLPERHEVALEELWPTLIQENTELNIERTADCIDRLRFFYTHVWMPWDNDNDDDFNWVEKHLESRIRLCFDLRQHNISRPIASFIRSLIEEAKYIQQKRDNIEADICDEATGKDQKAEGKLTQLMHLHLRLRIIRSDIEMLENPEMRQTYEEVKFNLTKSLKLNSAPSEKDNNDPVCYIVMLPSNITEHMQLMQNAQKTLPNNIPVLVSHCLQDVLDTCKSCDQIYLSVGCHKINIVEYFFNKGSLIGLNDQYENNKDIVNPVRLYSPVDNKNLLIFDGDFTLENLELDCRNILTGIIVKHGTLTIKNCTLIGNGKSSIQQGLVCCGHASIHLYNCVIDSFATGITLNDHASLILKDSIITDCNIGLELSEYSKVESFKSSFIKCSSYAVFLYGESLVNVEDKYMPLSSLEDLEKHLRDGVISGNCSFKHCKNNICLLNNKDSIVFPKMFHFMDNVF